MKKRVLAGALTFAAAAAVMLTVNTDTEAASRRIYIDGSRTAWVGRTIELDVDGAFDDDYVRDSRIVWKSSKPSVAKVIRKRGDDTRIKARKAGTAKITVRIQGTSLKATMKIKVKKTSQASRKWNTSKGSNSDAKKLEKYRKQIKEIFKQIKNVNWKVSASQRRTLYYTYAGRLKDIDHKLDRMNDKWDDRWGWTAEKMDDAIDRVEDYLDEVEDYLEDRFDWDDDFDDRDNDDDWDDEYDNDRGTANKVSYPGNGQWNDNHSDYDNHRWDDDDDDDDDPWGEDYWGDSDDRDDDD